MDDRDLFPEAIRLVKECEPKAVLLENVRGLLDPKFEDYRKAIIYEIEKLGYKVAWRLLNASDYGVSQLRPRAILVAIKKEYFDNFVWPQKHEKEPVTVGELLFEDMSKAGWKKAKEWKIVGRKTAAYRQIGNAFPPPVAKVVGASIYKALNYGK
jgi:DNA (cytosine-5)-methyltransferase 1